MKIGFVGDVSFTGIFSDKNYQEENIFDEKLKVKFQECDKIIANIEGPFCDSEIKNDVKINISSPTNCAQFLVNNNIKIWNLANNHIYDNGEIGLNETRRIAKNNCAEIFGLIESPSISIENNTDSILIIGVMQHYEILDLGEVLLTTSQKETLEYLISKGKEEGKKIIVNYHGFEEYTLYPIKAKTIVCKSFIDMGADVVIGHHPHVIQGFEIYQGKPIFYSLGNFIFDIPQHDSRKYTSIGLFLVLDINEEVEFETNFIQIDKEEGFIYLLDKHPEITEYLNYCESEWEEECFRLLFKDSAAELAKGLKLFNPIHLLKFLNRYRRLLSSYFRGGEAYQPILYSSISHILKKWR